ncbi:hypothetical protein ACEPAH_2881 [Sanghuangporus vaninii]
MDAIEEDAYEEAKSDNEAGEENGGRGTGVDEDEGCEYCEWKDEPPGNLVERSIHVFKREVAETDHGENAMVKIELADVKQNGNRPEPDDVENDHRSQTLEESQVDMKGYSNDTNSMRYKEEQHCDDKLGEEEEQRDGCGV